MIAPVLRTLEDLPLGYRAYVDADWSSSLGGGGPAIVADGSGSLMWTPSEGMVVRELPVKDPDVAASRAIAWVADRATAAARACGRDIEVTGRGATANAVRRLLAVGPTVRPSEVGRPAGIVLTSAGVEELVAATQRVADLGRIVIAAEFREAIAFDLYPDVHLRGLTLVGVPGPLEDDGDLEAHPLESLILESLIHLEVGSPIPDGSWLCFHR